MYQSFIFNYLISAKLVRTMTLQLKQYRKQLSKSKQEDIFLLPWGGVVCRNCDNLGDLLTFKNIPQYRENGEPLWLLLSLVLFRENVL